MAFEEEPAHLKDRKAVKILPEHDRYRLLWTYTKRTTSQLGSVAALLQARRYLLWNYCGESLSRRILHRGEFLSEVTSFSSVHTLCDT